MSKNRKTQRHRVSTRLTAEYRAVPAPEGVPAMVASMFTFLQDLETLHTACQTDAAAGAAYVHTETLVLLSATPAADAREAAMKAEILELALTSGSFHETPPKVAMAEEAIRYERGRWNLEPSTAKPH